MVEAESNTEVSVFTVDRPAKHLYHTLQFCNGRTLDVIIDTGSPVTFFPFAHFTSLGFNKANLRISNTTIKGVSRHNLAVFGKFRPRVWTAGGSIVDLDVLVTEDGLQYLASGLRALKVQLLLGALLSLS